VLGVNVASLGDVQAGLDHLEQAMALFDSSQQRPAPFRLGASPGVVVRTTSALQLWAIGFPDRAVERAEEAVALAQKLNHPFTLANTLCHVGYFALWRDEFELVHERATGALQVADEHDYEIWRALGLVLQGVALTGLGQSREGLARTEQGVSLYRGLDTPPVFWPLLLAIRARNFALAGRPADGLPFIDGRSSG
jgi:predicted ATPase